MIESKFEFKASASKLVEKIINDGNAMINHMIFPEGEGLPEHFANSNVYMIIIEGTLSLQLDDQEDHKYAKGSIVNVPYDTKMNVRNKDEETLEMFVIKAPSPENYQE